MLEHLKFPIKEVKLKTEHDISTNLVGIYNKEEYEFGEVDPPMLLGYHTKDYIVTPNETIIDSAVEIIDDMGLKIIKTNHRSSWTNKKRMYANFVTDKSFSMGDDDYHLMLSIHNSYDGSMSWGCELAFWRQICSNGAYVSQMLKRYKHKHFIQFKPEILREQINGALIRFPELRFLVKKLKDTDLTADKIEKIFDAAAARNLTSKDERESMKGIIDINMNALAVMNAITYYLTHVAKSYERARKLNSFIIGQLAKVTGGR